MSETARLPAENSFCQPGGKEMKGFSLSFPSVFLLLPVCALLPFVFTCGYPSDSENRDIIEIERVWQYVRAFSIYGSDVPTRGQALASGNAAAMVSLLPDTLYSHYEDITYRFAGYGEPCGGASARRGSTVTPAQPAEGIITKGSVSFLKITPATAYIRIDSFVVSTDSDLRFFGTSADSVENLIIDLLFNPGGSLDACSLCVEQFLAAGVEYLYSTYRKYPQYTGDTGTISMEKWVSRRSGDLFEGKNVVMLGGRYSASASEIFIAGLMHGLPDTSVVFLGEPTYGKAIGQYSFCLWRTSGLRLRLTGFRFFPISGTVDDYHEKGITPNVEIPVTNRWDVIAAGGEVFEPGFGGLVDSSIISAFNYKILQKGLLRPSCYKELSESEMQLF
jgi:hypothetical protein